MPPVVAAVASVIVTAAAATPIVSVIGIGGLTIAANVIASVGVYGALSLASSALSQAVAPKQRQQSLSAGSSGSLAGQKPSDGQQTVRQAVTARKRHYGRVKIGGAVVFYESRNGFFYVLVVLGQGPLDAIEEHWLNDQQVTLDASGLVQEDPFIHDGRSRIKIETQLGETDQAAQPTLLADFSEWTNDHRMRGAANVLTVYEGVPSEAFSTVYRGGAPTYRTVLRGVPIWDPRTGVTAWDDNAALVILDYLTSDDGMKRPVSKIDIESFKVAADVCDELVALKIGGSERRYRIWGSYALDEEPRDVLPRMLAACDGYLYQKADGLIALDAGIWTAPTVTLDDAQGHIKSAVVRQGNDALSAFNEMKFLYLSAVHDYQEQEGSPWRDEANIAARGEVLEDRSEYYLVPSHSQARRLAKIATHLGNPRWSLTLRTTLYGMQCIGERIVHVKLSELGIDETFRVTSLTFLDDGTGFEISLSSFAADAYDWDAATEEGEAPVVPADTSGSFSLTPPSNISVVPASVGGTKVLVSWDRYPTDGFFGQIRWRQSGSAGQYEQKSAGLGEQAVYSDILNSGTSYDVSARTISPAGSPSEWSSDITVVATPNTSAPAAATSLAVTVNQDDVQLTWTNPADTNFGWVNVHRNTVDDFGSSTLIASVYGLPGSTGDYDDEGLAAGTYYYWVQSANASGTFGPATPSVMAAVT